MIRVPTAVLAAALLKGVFLAWLLPPFAVCFWIGAWLMAGSSRMSYVGLQACYAFAIATLADLMEFLNSDADSPLAAHAEAVARYRERYGA